jgi:hypothetical protein
LILLLKDGLGVLGRVSKRVYFSGPKSWGGWRCLVACS